MNERDKKFNPSNLPDDELIQLDDFDFDFEDYFERYGSGTMDEGEQEEYSARVYGYFCQLVYASKDDPVKIPFWVANYITKKFRDALGGVPWPDTMRLPWDIEENPFFTAKGKRAVDIYRAITNGLSADPSANVTSLIAEQAGKYCVSYETARADYYAFKKAVDKKAPMPKSFLNNRDED